MFAKHYSCVTFLYSNDDIILHGMVVHSNEYDTSIDYLASLKGVYASNVLPTIGTTTSLDIHVVRGWLFGGYFVSSKVNSYYSNSSNCS